MTTSSGDAVTLALVAVLATAGVVWWRAAVLREDPPAKAESWAHVEERYPMPEPLPGAAEVSPTLLEAMLRANPFSPDRRSAFTPDEPAVEEAAPVALPPKFVYKGRVVMGSKQRAVVEEQTSKKTHFLQVGQEVAGFKVLDIAENRVLLSDQSTQEELNIFLTQPDSSRVGSSEKR
jgi:hypothetical protein